MHKTINIDDGYIGSGKILLKSIKKHGLENFKKEILFIFDNEEDMKNKEKELVTEEFCKREDTYNICEGGKGGFGYINQNNIGGFKGRKHSEETKKKLAKLAKINEKFTTKGLDPWNKGKSGIYTEEQLKKWKVPCSEKKKNKISNSLKGHKHSEETKLKMSKARKGRIVSLETREKIRQSLKITREKALSKNAILV